MARYIFITGGVVSSLGKGLASAALGALLQARGYSVRLRKLDPYLNVDPGTMSPYQHGEVFVTDDGAETDLDLGHYERFTGVPAQAVRQHHHRPHLPGHPRQGAARRLSRRHRAGDPARHRRHQGLRARRQRRASTSCWCEIGGTVGDIEGLPFFEAIRQLGNELPRGDCVLHPPDAAAVHPERRRAEDQADAALGEGAALDRHPARHPAVPLRPADARRPSASKIALFCNVRAGGGDPGAGRRLHLRRAARLPPRGARRSRCWPPSASPTRRRRSSSTWQAISRRHRQPRGRGDDRHRRQVHRPQGRLQVAHRGADPRRHRQQRQGQARVDRERDLRGRGPGALPGGRRTASWCPAASASAARRARSSPPASRATRKVPYFGICFGMQMAVIEAARDLVGIAKAGSTEFGPTRGAGGRPDDRVDARQRAGEAPARRRPRRHHAARRLSGAARPRAASVAEIYGATHDLRAPPPPLRGQHRLPRRGWRRRACASAGMSPDGLLPEIIELPDHPWFIGVQFHPELKSRPFEPHPLFAQLHRGGGGAEPAGVTCMGSGPVIDGESERRWSR